MTTTVNAGLDAMLDIIHEPHPSLAKASTEDVIAYLSIVAGALLEGWYTTLEDLTDRYAADNVELEEEILKVFRANKSTKGIMKVAVYINHQWVVKLGDNSILEADIYNGSNTEDRASLVPTVSLGDFGCLQLKVTIPENSKGWGFDSNEVEKQYSRMTHDNNDVHRGNVGIWKGRLLHLDFAGG